MWVVYDKRKHEVVGKFFSKSAAKNEVWWRYDLRDFSIEKVASAGCKGFPTFDEWWLVKTLAYTKPVDLP